MRLPRRLFPSLRRYHAGRLRGDLVAGLSVWAVLVPEALTRVFPTVAEAVVAAHALRRGIELPP